MQTLFNIQFNARELSGKYDEYMLQLDTNTAIIYHRESAHPAVHLRWAQDTADRYESDFDYFRLVSNKRHCINYRLFKHPNQGLWLISNDMPFAIASHIIDRQLVATIQLPLLCVKCTAHADRICIVGYIKDGSDELYMTWLDATGYVSPPHQIPNAQEHSIRHVDYDNNQLTITYRGGSLTSYNRDVVTLVDNRPTHTQVIDEPIALYSTHLRAIGPQFIVRVIRLKEQYSFHIEQDNQLLPAFYVAHLPNEGSRSIVIQPNGDLLMLLGGVFAECRLIRINGPAILQKTS